MPSAPVHVRIHSSSAAQQPLKAKSPSYRLLLASPPRDPDKSLQRLAVAALVDAGRSHCVLVSVVLVAIMSAAIGAAEAQGTWSTAQLSVARNHLAATSVGNLAIFAGGKIYLNSDSTESDAVDLYNSASGTWSTARLSVARYNMGATSVGNLAFFAGGYNPFSGTLE